MIYDVHISKRADADLRGIYEYIAFQLLAPEHASRQLDRLEEQISKLDFMAKRFRRYDREPWYSRGLRVMPVDHYVVFYIPDEGSATVNVLRVMYSGQDVDRKLERLDQEIAATMLEAEQIRIKNLRI